jgi:hypothetical protein
VFLLYLAAVVAANLTIAFIGPAAVPLVSFFLVGFIITTRDVVHERWYVGESPALNLFARMGGLILAGGTLTVLLNVGALPIAIASVAAFVFSELANALVYHPMWKREVPFLKRVNIGNVVNAALDSVIFVSIAFGFTPEIIAMQIAAKVLGGAVWSVAYAALKRRQQPALR